MKALTTNPACMYIKIYIYINMYIYIYIIIYLLYITILFPKFKFSYFESSQANVIFHVLMLTSIVDRTNLNTVSSILHWFSFQVLPAPSLLHNWSRLQNSFDDILFMFLLENLISFAYSLSKLHISSCLGKSSGPVCSVTAFFTSHWPRTSPEPIKQTASPETSSSMRGRQGNKGQQCRPTLPRWWWVVVVTKSTISMQEYLVRLKFIRSTSTSSSSISWYTIVLRKVYFSRIWSY